MIRNKVAANSSGIGCTARVTAGVITDVIFGRALCGGEGLRCRLCRNRFPGVRTWLKQRICRRWRLCGLFLSRPAALRRESHRRR